jgi:signal transduction histidine kinase
MLDVARCASGRFPLSPVATDVASLARGVVARLETEAASARCPIELKVESSAIAEIDPERIEQVLENLLTNAIRYGAGRSIDVSVGSRPGVVRIAVEDQGIGVAPEDQERIFGLFERAVSERRYGGLGLGLYIARHAVEAHGGRIACVSAPNAGARFEVELPATQLVLAGDA